MVGMHMVIRKLTLVNTAITKAAQVKYTGSESEMQY